jgi:hypothetical protein
MSVLAREGLRSDQMQFVEDFAGLSLHDRHEWGTFVMLLVLGLSFSDIDKDGRWRRSVQGSAEDVTKERLRTAETMGNGCRPFSPQIGYSVKSATPIDGRRLSQITGVTGILESLSIQCSGVG